MTLRVQDTFCLSDREFSSDFCQKITSNMEDNRSFQALARGDMTAKKRNTAVSWIKKTSETKWIFDPIWKLLGDANKMVWNWDITEIEDIQYTIYEPGQYYNWHVDDQIKPYPKSSPWAGLTRKLTAVINLSEPDGYQGGDFRFELPIAPPDEVDQRIVVMEDFRAIGAALVFPSHLFHEVTEVSSGSRRTLVAWSVGPPMR